ncbi:hypothetical protein RJT34_04620 [Clitoria ternatea]|uniref:Filament-like plant protein 7 n=1 Tax=Clitoria ternatea TaxID=43366 RepID=A0AAN9Q2U2_CLITE
MLPPARVLRKIPEIMNHKPWLWRKKSMEKTIFAVDKVVSNSSIIEEEVHKRPTDDKETTGLERSSKSLNEKLATVLLDSHSGDDPLVKHNQKSQQDIIGKDNEVKSVEDFDKRTSAETVPPTATVQEPLQPLSYVQDQEDQEHMLCGAISKITKEHEKIQKEMEEKLRETSKRIDELTAENTHLANALLTKEKSIGDLVKNKEAADAEFSTLMARLDSTEKENAFLRYEFHMLEKELEVQKEEIDYSRQYVDASHKQYLESSQKASKLEAECQRLRLLQRKRSPGSAGLVNVKNEVGMMRRRKSNSGRELIYKNNDNGNSTDVTEKSFSMMIKRLQDLDEENKALKRILTKKNSELDSSRMMYAETASRLSQAEILLRKISENQKSMELTRCYPPSNQIPLISNFDIYSDDGAISSGSWANALMSELEHLRTTEAKNHRSNSDMSFMDDFVEMEKRAIVSIDTTGRGYCSDVSGRELVPVEQDHLGFSERKQEIQFKHTTNEESFDWLQTVLNAILEEKCLSQRSLHELLDDIKIALGCMNQPTACESDRIQKCSETKQDFNSSLRKSVHRIINLIGGIAPKSFICNNCPDCLKENQHSDKSQSPTSKEFFVHVFQWQVSDLSPLLHQLIHTCKDLLTGRADFESFVEEVAFALEWSINNCATSTNAAIARDKIRKHFSCHLSQNENKIDVEDNQSSRSPLFAYPDDQCEFNTKNNQCDLLEETRKLKDDLRSAKTAKKDLEMKLLSVTDESQNLTKQCQEAENNIRDLESEIETLKESKSIIEDQIEKQKLVNEDLDTQLTIAQAKLSDIFQKFSSLEVELEDKKNSCEELESTCLELQLQLESIAKKEPPTYGRYEVEKIYQTGWEITTASSKLAECQETILNLGKQLKALATSSEQALFDKVVSTTSTMANPTQKKNLIKRSSLRNQMQAEDDAKAVIHEEVNSDKDVQKPSLLENEKALQTPNSNVNVPETSLTSEKNDSRSKATGSVAIVPTRRQVGFGFLRKLLSRQKKGKGKGTKLLAKA